MKASGSTRGLALMCERGKGLHSSLPPYCVKRNFRCSTSTVYSTSNAGDDFVMFKYSQTQSRKKKLLFQGHSQWKHQLEGRFEHVTTTTKSFHLAKPCISQSFMFQIMYTSVLRGDVQEVQGSEFSVNRWCVWLKQEKNVEIKGCGVILINLQPNDFCSQSLLNEYRICKCSHSKHVCFRTVFSYFSIFVQSFK